MHVPESRLSLPRPGSALRFTALVFLLVIAGPFLSSDGAAAESRAELERATVRWDPGLGHIGRQVAQALPTVRREVARRLGLGEDEKPIEVVVVAGHDRMCAEAAAHVPTWAVGVAISARHRIVIRSDLLARGFGGGVVPVLRHECVHMAWGRFAGVNRRKLPLWAEEGIAEEIGGGVSVDAGATLDLAVTFDWLLEFEQLDRSFPADAHQADLAYKQSRSWIRHFVKKVGWRPLREVLTALREADPEDLRPGESRFDRELKRSSGKPLGEWHAAWRVALEEEAAPWYHLLLRDFQGLIITGLALIGAAVFVFLVRRRRRQIAELPDEGAHPAFAGRGFRPGGHGRGKWGGSPIDEGKAGDPGLAERGDPPRP